MRVLRREELDPDAVECQEARGRVGNPLAAEEGDEPRKDADPDAACERGPVRAAGVDEARADDEVGAKTADPLAMYLNDFCTVPMSLAGIPGISIPNGLSEGLPVGFQIAGPAFSEIGRAHV